MIDKWEITAYTTLRDNEMLRKISVVSSSDISRNTTDFYNIKVYVGSKGGGLDLLGSFYGNKNTLEAGTPFPLPGNYADRRMRNGESLVVSLTRQGKPEPFANSYTVQIVMAVTAGASDKEQPFLADTMDLKELRPGYSSAEAHAIQSSGVREWSISVPLQDPTDNTDYVEIDTATGYAKTSQLGSGTASSSTYLRGDSAWVNPDPWTYVVLGSDFTTTNSTNTDVTGLAFTPASNKKYIIEMMFMFRSASTTIGARCGITWPTAGITDNVGYITAANGATTVVHRTWGQPNTQYAAVTGVVSTSYSYPAFGAVTLIMGAGATGNFKITLASTTGGTTVTMKANSYFRYREFP